MRKIITATFISILFYSCIGPNAVPGRIKKEMYCYEGGQPTGIDSLINIMGYYTLPNYAIRIIGNDTIVSKFNIVFFNDGIIIIDSYLIYFKYPNNVKDTNSENNPPSKYLNAAAGYSKLRYGQFSAGIYRISHDTIKTQILEPGSSNTYYAYEYWYKVINQNAIKLIYAKALGVERLSEEYFDGDTSYFVKATDTLPVSKIWLKKKKWFWCEDAWKKRKQTE